MTRSAHNDAVIPSENCKFIELIHKIPPRSDVSGYEYSKSENGEGVHGLRSSIRPVSVCADSCASASRSFY